MATVDILTGQVTAVGTGAATIFVDATPGIRGTKLIRTLPNFGGSWEGMYRETDCQSSGEFALRIRSCDYWDEGFATGPTTLTLTQDRDRISGSFTFGPFDVSGSVSPVGTLSFTGSHTGTARQFTQQLQNVRFELTPNGQMIGTFEHVWSSGTTSLTGTLRVVHELRAVRVSGG